MVAASQQGEQLGKEGLSVVKAIPGEMMNSERERERERERGRERERERERERVCV